MSSSSIRGASFNVLPLTVKSTVDFLMILFIIVRKFLSFLDWLIVFF